MSYVQQDECESVYLDFYGNEEILKCERGWGHTGTHVATDGNGYGVNWTTPEPSSEAEAKAARTSDERAKKYLLKCGKELLRIEELRKVVVRRETNPAGYSAAAKKQFDILTAWRTDIEESVNLTISMMKAPDDA